MQPRNFGVEQLTSIQKFVFRTFRAKKENQLRSEQAKRLWASLAARQVCPSNVKNKDFAQLAKSKRFTMRTFKFNSMKTPLKKVT